jgi:endonuclease G
MTKLRKFTIRTTTLLLLGVAVITCSQVKRVQSTQQAGQPLEWPEVPAGQQVVQHTGFSLLFDATHKQARWVAYALRAEHTQGKEPRLSRFYPDPLLGQLTASDADYYKSGYDRGHLAPAADMSWSAQALRESFYYSNVSPQKPAFNRGVWKKLEMLVRSWAQTHSVVYVATGPVLYDTLKKIPHTAVSVPEYFYKAVLVYSASDKKCIGFILKNERANLAPQAFAVSIDSLEAFTGLNFFAALPDPEEEELEKSLCVSCWP